MLDNVLHVYVAGDNRKAWALKIAEVLEYTTLIEGTGVTVAWGSEPVTLVQHFFSPPERQWSIYDHLFPAIREYAVSEAQECVYATLQSYKGIRGFLLDPQETDYVGDWHEFAGWLILS
jgi:hypothetical protein